MNTRTEAHDEWARRHAIIHDDRRDSLSAVNLARAVIVMGALWCLTFWAGPIGWML